jgi:hypothetical protein
MKSEELLAGSGQLAAHDAIQHSLRLSRSFAHFLAAELVDAAA